MYKKTVAAAFCVILLPTVADAQLVRVGPLGGVRVRAPFVRVDVSPFGDTRVRAPFTAVDAPGRRFLRRGSRYRSVDPYRYDYRRNNYYPLPSYPLPSYRAAVPQSYRQAAPTRALQTPAPRTPAPRYDVPRYSDVFPSSSGRNSSGSGWQVGDDPTQLAQRLRDAGVRLERSLERREDGSIWINYLRPEAVQRVGQNLAESRSLRSASLPEARSLLANFDGVAANPSLRWLMELNGFRDSRQSLQALVTVLQSGGGASPTAGSSQETPPAAPRPEPDRQLNREELPSPPPDPQPRSEGQPRSESQRRADAERSSDVEPPPAPRPDPAEMDRSGATDGRGTETEPPPAPRPSSNNQPAAEERSPRLRPPIVQGDV